MLQEHCLFHTVSLALFPSCGFDPCHFLPNMGRGVGAGLYLTARMLCYFRTRSFRVIYFLFFYFGRLSLYTSHHTMRKPKPIHTEKLMNTHMFIPLSGRGPIPQLLFTSRYVEKMSLPDYRPQRLNQLTLEVFLAWLVSDTKEHR